MTDAFARITDPGTSHAAANSISQQLPKLEALVLAELEQRGGYGATTEELSRTLGLSIVTVSPRLRPLAKKGLVVASSLKRPGTSGRRSIVWKTAERTPTQERLPL